MQQIDPKGSFLKNLVLSLLLLGLSSLLVPMGWSGGFREQWISLPFRIQA
jgi:hypothetical protein